MKEYPGWSKADWNYIIQSPWGKELNMCDYSNNTTLDLECSCEDFVRTYTRQKYQQSLMWFLNVVEQMKLDGECEGITTGCDLIEAPLVTSLNTKIFNKVCLNQTAENCTTTSQCSLINSYPSYGKSPDDTFYFYNALSFVGVQECLITPTELSALIPSSHCYTTHGITVAIILNVLIGIIAGLITVANGFIIFVLAKMPKRSFKYVYYFKLNITIADFLLGIQCMIVIYFEIKIAMNEPIEIYLAGTNALHEQYLRRDKHYHILNVLGMLTYLPVFVSLYSLMLHSVERFMIIRSMVVDTEKIILYSKISVIVVWVTGLLLACIPFMHDGMLYLKVSFGMFLLTTDRAANGLRYSVEFMVIAIIYYGILLISPLIIITVTNIALFITYSRTRSRVHTSSSIDDRLAKYKLAKTLAIMVAVLAISILPVFAFIMYDITTGTFNPNVGYPCYIMLCINSLLNSIIYVYRSDDFCKEVKRIFDCSICTRKMRPSNTPVSPRVTYGPKTSNITSTTDIIPQTPNLRNSTAGDKLVYTFPILGGNDGSPKHL